MVTKGNKNDTAMYPAEWGRSFGSSLESTTMKELLMEKEKDPLCELGFLTVKTEAPLSEKDQADIRIKTSEILEHMKNGIKGEDDDYGA